MNGASSLSADLYVISVRQLTQDRKMQWRAWVSSQANGEPPLGKVESSTHELKVVGSNLTEVEFLDYFSEIIFSALKFYFVL